MGVLYVNKPKGMTSFDVCNKLRRVLQTKKIGHTGTLDPNASGVMIVLYNEATKANQFLLSSHKEYIGECLLGISTDTLDIDGNIIEEKETKVPLKEELEAVFKSFIGSYNQIPPLTSAKKINGKRAYEYQREGKTVELKPCKVDIYSLDLLSITEKGFIFKTKVSSGTYIRSLLKDILDKLSIIGTLKELERISVDDVSINMCDSLDTILNNNYHSYDMYDLLSKKLETIEVNNVDDIKNGKRIKLNSESDMVLLVNNKKCLAVYQKDNLEYKCVRGLF